MQAVTRWMQTIARSNVSLLDTERLRVAAVYKCLVTNPSSDMMEKAFILDWSMEFFHGSNVISNNIMDGKTVKVSGNPAWHTLKNVGMMAVNDAFILKGLAYNAIKLYFGEQVSKYNLLEDLRNEGCEKYILGRGLYERSKIDNCTNQLASECWYRQMIDFTYGYNSFYIPVMLALVLAGKVTDSTVENDCLKDVLLDIGYYYQIQRDYTRIFLRDDKSVVTKDELKCNWFFVKCTTMLHKNDPALSRLQDCIEQKKLSELQRIYKENGLLEIFNEKRNLLARDIAGKIVYMKRISHDKGVANFMHLLRCEI